MLAYDMMDFTQMLGLLAVFIRGGEVKTQEENPSFKP